MNLPTLTRALGAAALSTLLAVSSAQAYSGIVAFGDSLSDTGNVQARLGAFGLDVPAAPYVQDRFSNGPVAVEVMAQALGVSLTSHAYGGAQTGLNNRLQLAGLLDGTGMQSQVNQFVGNLGGSTADASKLYFLWGGANDLFTTLESPSPDPAGVIGTAVTNLSTQVTQLYASGAREFFVPLMPDLAYSYGGVQGGPDTQAQLSMISGQYNGNLAGAMGQLRNNLSGATIHVFDTQALLDVVRADLQAAGGVVDAPCWTGDYTGGAGALCADADQFYLFDAVHPTALVHRSVGLAMAAAVPEPQALALLMAGLVSLGIVTWRRSEGAGS